MESNLSDLYHEIIAEPAPPQARLGLSAFAWQALGYLLALTIAEVVTTLIEPRVGLALHGIILLALITHASLSLGRLQGGFLLALAFGSLIRLLSLSTPLPYFPKVYWYMVIGAPLLLAAFVAARVSRLDRGMVGLRVSWRGLPVQILVGASGFGLGLLEYLILRPEPLAARLSLEAIWLPALILMVFTGFLEEYIFRGLMQYTAARWLGRFGLLYVAVVFAVLHIGYRSVLDVIFVFAVAVFFGWVVARTGSLLGATLAHGLTNITLFLVFPFLAAHLLPGFGGVQLPQTVTPSPSVTQALVQPATATPTLAGSLTPTSSLTPSSSPTAAPRLDLTATLTASPTESPMAPATTTGAPTGSVTPTSATPSPTITPLAPSLTASPPSANPSLTPTSPTPTETRPTASPSLSPTVSGPTPSHTTTQPPPSRTPSPSPTPTRPTATPSPTSSAPPNISAIVDDGDPGFSARGGPFTFSSEGMFGDMLWAATTLQEVSAEVEWGYPFATCGRYLLEVYLPPNQAASQAALYQIGHRSGMASRLVDQSAYPGKWVSLGEFEFLPNGGSFLRLANATGEDPALGLRLLFDAVRWTLLGPCR